MTISVFLVNLFAVFFKIFNDLFFFFFFFFFLPISFYLKKFNSSASIATLRNQKPNTLQSISYRLNSQHVLVISVSSFNYYLICPYFNWPNSQSPLLFISLKEKFHNFNLSTHKTLQSRDWDSLRLNNRYIFELRDDWTCVVRYIFSKLCRPRKVKLNLLTGQSPQLQRNVCKEYHGEKESCYEREFIWNIVPDVWNCRRPICVRAFDSLWG